MLGVGGSSIGGEVGAIEMGAACMGLGIPPDGTSIVACAFIDGAAGGVWGGKFGSYAGEKLRKYIYTPSGK